MNTIGNAQERLFELPWIKLAGKHWNNGGSHKIMALHGWLDSAASFDMLAPQLVDAQVLALDAAGNGHSGFRSNDSAYNIWQDVGDNFCVADQMGWDTFILVAHSRGAAVASLMAATFPDRISKLVLLDGGAPQHAEIDETPQILAKSISDRQKYLGRSPRIFKTRDIAISERVLGFIPVTEQAAEMFAERSLRSADAGYYWHGDQMQKATSELKLTPTQINSFLAAITAPVLSLIALQGITQRYDVAARLKSIKQLQTQSFAGGHHFHMEPEPCREIAHAVNSFLGVDESTK